MKIEVIKVGSLSVNCYIVYDENEKDGMIIDPGGNAEDIIARVKSLGLQIKYIVFTHVHFDHILAYHKVKDAFETCELILSEKEVDALSDNRKSLLCYVPEPFLPIKNYTVKKHKDTLKFLNMEFEILETPGHTEGSICLYGHGVVFSGDTLFQGSIGRGDFPGGSIKKEIDSIKNILFKLPDNTVVYPGHEDKTTIAYEKMNNEVVGWI